MFYSETTGGFYSADIHGENIPSDAIEVSADEYLALLHGQSSGMSIAISASGRPSLVEPAPLTSAQIKSGRLAANNDSYNAATMALTANYPQLEKDTWPTQDAESRAWLADPVNASTPWIARAAAERGLDCEEYLRRTLVKAEQFKVISAFLTGRRQRYEDQIKAGGDPVLDYALTPSLLAELDQIASTIMSTPAAGLQEALA